ncbi:MAG: hypothetical protein ABSF67_22420, partial [Roseiarcus sp.]
NAAADPSRSFLPKALAGPPANRKLSPIIPVQFVTYLAGLHTRPLLPQGEKGRHVSRPASTALIVRSPFSRTSSAADAKR